MVFGSKSSIAIIIAYKKGYRVTECGNIISPNGTTLTCRKNASGYYSVTIRHNGNMYLLYVHQLQAYQLYGNEIFKNDCIRHLNSNSLDNSSINISIGSHHENKMDMPEQKRKQISSKANKKYSDELAIEIRRLNLEGYSYNLLMEMYSISSKGTISHIIKTRKLA